MHGSVIRVKVSLKKSVIQDEFSPVVVDHVRNGMFLKNELHTAFDNQYWSVVEDGDKLRVVKLHASCPPGIEGVFLLPPDKGILLF